MIFPAFIVFLANDNRKRQRVDASPQVHEPIVQRAKFANSQLDDPYHFQEIALLARISSVHCILKWNVSGILF